MHLTAELKPLTQSPAFPMYITELQQFWEDEQRQRAEFIEWLTPSIKAEFINGDVVVHSPAKDRHTVAQKNLTQLLDTFVEENDLGAVRNETTLISLTRNDYLPDVCFFGVEKASGISADQIRYTAPDFIAEVLSPSTEKTDRETKMEDYAAHGVWEYWLVDPVSQTVEQYLLHDGSYDLVLKVREGSLRSDIVEGFEIPVAAIFDGKLKNRILLNMLTRQT